MVLRVQLPTPRIGDERRYSWEEIDGRRTDEGWYLLVRATYTDGSQAGNEDLGRERDRNRHLCQSGPG